MFYNIIIKCSNAPSWTSDILIYYEQKFKQVQKIFRKFTKHEEIFSRPWKKCYKYYTQKKSKKQIKKRKKKRIYFKINNWSF